MSEKEINFEQELNRLKEIVSLIQQKDLSLDESTTAFEVLYSTTLFLILALRVCAHLFYHH